MFDLIALAYQADLTRVASYVMVAEGTNRTYNHVGVPDSFHPVSHHSNDRERIRRLTIIQRYHMERFAEFLKKLAEHQGRRRQHPRPFAVPLRLEHGQQQPARQLSAAGDSGRRRERQARRRQERRAARAHAAGQRAPDDPGQARDRAGQVRQQHRRASPKYEDRLDRRSFLQAVLRARGLSVPLVGGLAGCQQLPSQQPAARRRLR